MIQIIGTRQSGRTTRLIKLCKRLNDEEGFNNTVIMVPSRIRAQVLMDMARALGCGDIPFPVTPQEIVKRTPGIYVRVLIDDMEDVMDQMLGANMLIGYSIQGPKMENEFGCQSWISEREIYP